MKAEFNPKKLIFITTTSVAVLFLVIYFISIVNGHNKLCNPFISGCSDITHAGFYPPESYMLKAVLIPTATLMAIIFFFIKEWLVQISDYNSAVIKQGKFMLFLAAIGCAGLVIGTSVIDGENTPLQFHIKCVSIFFVSMTICQVWYTLVEYKYFHKVNKNPIFIRYFCLTITVVTAIVSIFMAPTYENQSIVEWWGVYALVLWFWTFSINKKVVSAKRN
ncbi:hypothetical protein [Allofrancisella frigidaquae]|uniref:CWH43-like N-terminal domain-containing protein n=1 Tax=Allofrancisella frigidaquae TaxID=1085644 RepID=A0A6M3HZX6_9GAMM|nr:hypothetical protein [Allofrancisella frigidaquae]QIV95186.1 hypothetical protein E3E15_07435 [Allofrancisella frigidaquae]